MTTPKYDDEAWENKWFNRGQDLNASESQINGLVIPDFVVNDPTYQQIISALPESMRSLFDEYITSLINPNALQE